MKSKSKMKMKSRMKSKRFGKSKSKPRTKSRQRRTRRTRRTKRKTSRNRRRKSKMRGGSAISALIPEIRMSGLTIPDATNTDKPALTIDALNLKAKTGTI